jgi:predicted ATPase
MATLEGIQIKNFRALEDVTLGRVLGQNQDELTRLIAVIGANGTGKSSLLDALSFLGDCLREGVEAACDKPQRQGFEKLRSKGASGPIQFDVRFRLDAQTPPINYKMHINGDKNGRPYVELEELIHKPVENKGKRGKPRRFLKLKKGKGDAWVGSDSNEQGRKKVALSSDQELGISTLKSFVEHKEIGAFHQFLSGWYLSYFVPELARKQPPAGAQPHLDRTGENLANYLQFIEKKQPAKFKLLLKRLSQKIPGLERIESDKTIDHRLVLKFFLTGFGSDEFFQQSMSDGTLKMLAYLLLMEDPNPASLVGIEEPENGLHHQLLGALASEFKAFAASGVGPQVLLTTHSPSLIDALSPDEVWILEKNKHGFTDITRAADIKGVKEMVAQGIPMGSLWYSNHFGIGSP